MTIAERYNPIIQAEKYSGGECHDIATLLCIIRDNPRASEACEKALQAFITRKKLGDTVSIKKIREEFGVL